MAMEIWKLNLLLTSMLVSTSSNTTEFMSTQSTRLTTVEDASTRIEFDGTISSNTVDEATTNNIAIESTTIVKIESTTETITTPKPTSGLVDELVNESTITPTPTNGFVDELADESCSCNLISNQCDVNCCCDQGCRHVKETFATCSDVSNIPPSLALPFCISQNIILDTNNLPAKSVSTENGLLCITDWNYDEKKSFSNPIENLSINDMESEVKKIKKQLPDNEFVAISPSSTDFKKGKKDVNKNDALKESMFEVGEPLIIFEKQDNSCSTFALPSSSFSSQCSFSSPSLFFVDQKERCFVKWSTKDDCLSLFDSDSKIYEKLMFLPGKIIKRVGRSFDVSDCDSPDGEFQSIVNVTLIGHSCSPTFQTSTQTCENALQSIDLFVKVDSKTGWINTVELRLSCGDIKAQSAKAISSSLKFEYMSINENISLPLSGNPGYLKGKPLLSGIYDEETKQIMRNNDNLSNWTLTVPKLSGVGSCDLDTKESVLFGFNSFQTCKWKSSLSNCAKLKEEILNFFGYRADQMVGKHGNSASSAVTEWVSILPILPEDLNENEDNNTCRIPFSMTLRFFMS